jgi:anaerobic selenocysteine-containing dehydrogenase
MELPEGQFWMMTIRSHDQFNTTIYGLDDRYRGVFNERRVVLMNREDMEDKNLKTKQIVDLTSHFEGEERHSRSYLVLPYDMPRGCVATYFPEANELIPVRSFADRSQTPTSKSVRVSISPSTL